LNLVGLMAAVVVGLALGLPLTVVDEAPLLLPPASTFLICLLLLVPQALLTGAVLLALSAYARSFREAQTYLLPVTMVVMVAVLPALAPVIKLESVAALIPIANVALALRGALEGRLSLPACAVALGATSLYATLALRQASALLLREEVVLLLEPAPLLEEASAEGRARRGLIFGALMLLGVYFAGTALQAIDLFKGLAVTLWVVVLVPALLYPLIFKLPWRESLGLRLPGVRNLLLAGLLAGAAFILMAAYLGMQSKFLPAPEKLEEVFRELLKRQNLSPPLQILLLVLSPAICEELLWRGAVQGELEPRRRPLRTVLTVGLFFGLFHLNIYRLIPTALVGVLLAFVRTRTGSILPCMVLHATYNGLLLCAGSFFDDGELLQQLSRPVYLIPAALGLVGGALCLRAR
jgi:sodium transport system permease protein